MGRISCRAGPRKNMHSYIVIFIYFRNICSSSGALALWSALLLALFFFFCFFGQTLFLSHTWSWKYIYPDRSQSKHTRSHTHTWSKTWPKLYKSVNWVFFLAKFPKHKHTRRCPRFVMGPVTGWPEIRCCYSVAPVVDKCHTPPGSPVTASDLQTRNQPAGPAPRECWPYGVPLANWVHLSVQGLEFWNFKHEYYQKNNATTTEINRIVQNTDWKLD